MHPTPRALPRVPVTAVLLLTSIILLITVSRTTAAPPLAPGAPVPQLPVNGAVLTTLGTTLAWGWWQEQPSFMCRRCPPPIRSPATRTAPPLT